MPDLDDWGSCTPSDRLIEIRSNQPEEERLDTLIHELLHAIKPNMSEQEVTRIADVLSVGLWKDSWRRKNAN